MANQLTAAQQKVARVLAAAVAGEGFVMAGGSALNALGLSDRLSEDIDAFSSTCADVAAAAAKAGAAFAAEGWDVEVDRESVTFCRLVVTTGRRRRTQVVVGLGQDSIEWGTQDSSVGPVLTTRELAANKVLAAFGRIKPRDLGDLRILSQHVPIARMLRDGRAKDDGFRAEVLAEMVERTLGRPEREWPPDVDVAEVRAWTRGFLSEIRSVDLSRATADAADEADGAAGSPGDGWVDSYRRRDGTVVGGYQRRARRKD